MSPCRRAARAMKKRAVLLPAAAAMGLHLYTVLFMADHASGWFLLLLLGWSWTPYIAILLIARKSSAGVAAGGAVAMLCADLATFYRVFIAPDSSTAALRLLSMPAWDLLCVMPLGMLAAYLVQR